jgi:hypothetical protein
MTKFFDIDAANEALVEVGPLLATLADQRAELIRLRDRTLAAHTAARIDGLGITLRDIERGLIDFPALAGGRQVWLCWELGEEDVAFWHELDTGFGSRRPLIELV